MSLRRFMHERNKYKEEPNFKQLAILYPEFRKVAINDISGKVKINFKDEESLRVLTKTLLKHDFDLVVDIPPNHLVPALPLRLNYILWIEDLLKHSGIDEFSSVHGIDIGTGAICIYPLLFSKIFKSKMTCTDIDPESVDSAKKNIKNNDLQECVEVILVEKESILKRVFQNDDEYSFVMCNPPFFETDKGLGKQPKQEPPRNAPTGNEKELEVQGGEKQFILRLLDESLEYKNKIKIYTTMFGQKNSLAFLRSELAKKGVANVTWTEFCQGFTKRWGIAWTFASKDEIDLSTAPVIRTRTEVQKLKKDKSMEIIFPARENLSSLDELVTTLKKWISELKIEMKEIQIDEDNYPCWACQLIAFNNTWSHARRKRRMAMRQDTLKKQCVGNSDGITEKLIAGSPESTKEETKTEENDGPLLICTLLAGQKGKNDHGDDDDNDDDSDDSDSETENEGDEKILKICMLYESGHGGKQSLETLRQYLVNKLNIREFFHKQQPSKPNKRKRKKKKLKKSD